MNTFKIKKQSGTYAELLEAYGFANLLSQIFDSINCSDSEIIISDQGLYYEVTTNTQITDDLLEKLNYFPLFKYVKQKIDSDVSMYPAYFDYPVQEKWKKERQTLLNQVYKEYNGKEKKEQREKRIENIKSIFESQKRIDSSLDVYRQIITSNNFPSFDKLYQNFHKNKNLFCLFIHEIIYSYGTGNYTNKGFEKIANEISFTKKVTATQLYNPSQGKGLNKLKANGLNGKNFDSSWISESLKVSGALSDMVCQLVKVGSSYDLKIFVPEYRQVKHRFKSILVPKFKKYLKGNTPIEIDILNILLLTQLVIENSGLVGRRQKVKNIVSGLHSVYQKDLGQNKAVVNIGFIQVPNFIEFGDKEENQLWIDILKEQRRLIGIIGRGNGKITSGLMLYRNFISGSDIYSFFNFSYWYAIYLSSQLSNKKYALAFSIETLNKFYKSMDTKELQLSEIISNDGFIAVANAIRKSTVILQYTPKESRKYNVRYGVAQNLQNKSKSKEDLAEFIGEFIALYNSETARQAEKDGKALRANVRENELHSFYSLLDSAKSAKLIGALLASYGFALPKKEVSKIEENKDEVQSENIEE